MVYILFYWYYVTTEALNDCVRDEPPLTNYILAILLGLITCGIYEIYWLYKFYEKLDKYLGTDNKVIFLVVNLVSLGIISTIISQDYINKHLDKVI